jgi:hypothetical protein
VLWVFSNKKQDKKKRRKESLYVCERVRVCLCQREKKNVKTSTNDTTAGGKAQKEKQQRHKRETSGEKEWENQSGSSRLFFLE